MKSTLVVVGTLAAIAAASPTAAITFNDVWMTARVIVALCSDSRVSGGHVGVIDVRADNGAVTLRGVVDSAEAKWAATEAAARAGGVQGRAEQARREPRRRRLAAPARP